MIPTPRPQAHGPATSVDGTDIAWYRYGHGDQVILFVPTWNLVDARVVGHQVVMLEPHATVITYDPRGAGASGRPEHGYDFPLHAADALAVLEANEIGQASLVTASRGLNAAVLLVTEDPRRFERVVAIAPYMQLESDPAPADPSGSRLGVPTGRGSSCRSCTLSSRSRTRPTSLKRWSQIGLEATPDVIVTQELELDWTRPALLLGTVSCPTLVVHGDSDKPVPVAHARTIVEAMPDARLELIPGGGHRPDIRSPALVNPLLHAFLVAA